jgi:outer membrane protein OmpA-like peptidoglycan-associated protein
MKSIYARAAFLAAMLGSPWTAWSQQQYYVVIGAFATEENASEFKDYLPTQSKDTSFTFTDKENLLHLYVLKTSDKEAAIAKTLMLKQEIEHSGSGMDRPALLQEEVQLPGNEPIIDGDATGKADADRSMPGASAYELVGSSGGIPAKPKGKFFKFTIETPEGNSIPGQVHHVDFANRRELAAYNTGTFVDLLQPGNNSKPMEVVCGVFGFKEIQKYINYSDPSTLDAHAFVDAQGAWVIPYILEPVEEGDVSVMYNVSFYKDAVIMRGQSQADLDQLVTMMRNNPNYQITIHSHCNGKNKREIIALGANKNFFDVSGSTTLQASAKQLTTFRAEAIKAYLVDHGIDASRAKIFSWGGSDMLVKESSPESNLNDRIEIEITRD